MENEYNARRSPKWGLEGGAGKDDHFPQNSAVEFLNPVRAHLPRGIRNLSPKRLAILLSDFENESWFGTGRKEGVRGVDDQGLVLAEPGRQTVQ